MDEVIVSYDFNQLYDFANKRPLLTNIKTLKNINNFEKVELRILSKRKRKDCSY